MRVGIGLGLGPDPEAAAAEAARQAKAAVPRPQLALAFGSIRLDQAKVHGALARELDPRILLGGSSYAEVTPAGVTKGSVALLLLDLDGAPVRFADAPLCDAPLKTGRDLARALGGRPDPASRALGLIVSGVSTGYEDQTLCGVEEEAGRFPVFGGMAGSDYDLGLSHPDFWINYQYAGPSLERQATRMALLELPPKDYRPAFGYEHGWEPVGPPIRLTRCRGSRVYEADGVPILDYYRQFLGEQASPDFFEQMIQRYGFSLLIQDRDRSRSVVKLPVAVDLEEGWVNCYPAEDLQGRSVQLILSSRRSLLRGARRAAESCRAALDGMKPAVVLLVSCCTRNAILHTQMGSELSAVQEVFGADVPVFGYYSGGEILPFLSRYEDVCEPGRALAGSHYHTTTVGLLALGCRAKPAALAVPGPASPLQASRTLERLREQLALSERTLDTAESFLANLSRKSYQDGERLQRQTEVLHRYTPHSVWEQVRQSVARGGDGLCDAEFHGAFMFLDVKGFTAFSEANEPGKVVEVLNQLFGPATEAVYAAGGDVDKFIGDCIFAAFPDARAAVEAARAIAGVFRELRAQGHPFSFRIGIHAGRAVRANVGSAGRREYTFIGDAVNLTQRLESSCPPGGVLVSEQAYEACKDTLPGALLRVLQVKGRREPVAAYELLLDRA